MLAACSTGDDIGSEYSAGTRATTPATRGPEGNERTLAVLEEGRRIWAASKIDSYRFTIEWLCLCPQTRGTIEVIDGDVVSISAMSEDADVSALDRTIDDLFAMAVAAADGTQYAGAGAPGEVTAALDAEYGIPVRVSADPLAGAVDDEFGWQITGFVALDGLAFEGSASPAGVHECALLTRGEVESLLGEGVPLGEYVTPAVTVSVCTWTGAGRSLVLTLFPAPADGLAEPFPDATPLDGAAGAVFAERDGTTLVATEAGGTVVALEMDGADAAVLADLLAAAVRRLP